MSLGTSTERWQVFDALSDGRASLANPVLLFTNLAFDTQGQWITVDDRYVPTISTHTIYSTVNSIGDIERKAVS